MRVRKLVTTLLLAPVFGAFVTACSADSGAGPDPIQPQFFELEFVGNVRAPVRVFTFPLGGWARLDSAVLIPYAIGRTIDQRLVNDRTGRGGTGGNTRDTTIARGQMMDIRVFSMMGPGTDVGSDVVSVFRDSAVVDVVVRDTVVIITRPHPDPAQAFADTGAFAGNELVISRMLNYSAEWGMPRRREEMRYRITR